MRLRLEVDSRAESFHKRIEGIDGTMKVMARALGRIVLQEAGEDNGVVLVKKADDVERMRTEFGGLSGEGDSGGTRETNVAFKGAIGGVEREQGAGGRRAEGVGIVETADGLQHRAGRDGNEANGA